MPRKKLLSDDQVNAKIDRLAYLIDFARISNNELCEKGDIKQDTLYRWQTHKLQGVSDKGAIKVVKMMRQAGIVCSTEWLLHGTGQEPYRDFSICGDTQPIDPDFSSEVEFFLTRNAAAIGMSIQDNAMEPQFKIDDYVGGYRVNTIDESLIGQLCIVQTDQKPDLLFRRVELGSKPNVYTLVCTNPTAEHPLAIPDVGLLMAAPLNWWRRK